MDLGTCGVSRAGFKALINMAKITIEGESIKEIEEALETVEPVVDEVGLHP